MSRKGLWGFVTKELGLNLKVFSPVKLVPYKYLNDFERWAKKFFKENILKNKNKSLKGFHWI